MPKIVGGPDQRDHRRQPHETGPGREGRQRAAAQDQRQDLEQDAPSGNVDQRSAAEIGAYRRDMEDGHQQSGL